MKNKGFTLIEALAIITILGIVSLIVVPIISNVLYQKDYSKIVCNYDGNATEYNIDKVISFNETTAVIENNDKVYEFQRSNCYLIRK